MGKYYKLYLNNNNKTILYGNNDFELENIVYKTRIVKQEKKIFFKTKTENIVDVYYDNAIVIGEFINGKMTDLVTGLTLELSESYKKTETGFVFPLAKRNFNTPNLSYYKKEEVSPSYVIEILNEYDEEDIVRYKETLEKIVVLSKENYEKNLEQQEKLKQDDIDAEKQISEFKVRYRR